MSAALAGKLGQLAVLAVLIAVALRYAHRHGFLRGWRARETQERVTTAETINHLARIDGEAGAFRDVRGRDVHGSYRARKTPIVFPIPIDPDHQSHVDH